MTQRKIDYWVIPPEADAEFVASMEEVLDTYAEPYDPRFPKLCMDEQPIQLLKETRVPIPATAKHPRRVDYEYERAGTASIFMFCEPPVRLAPGERAGAANEDRLGDGSRGTAEDPVCAGGKSHPDLRQPEHAYQGCFLRSVRSGDRAGNCASLGIPAHSQAW
jgi:hypothetical protein